MTSCCLVTEVFFVELQTCELQLTFNVGRRLFVGRITKPPQLRYRGWNVWSDSTTSALTYKSSHFEWANLHFQLDWWEKLPTLIDMLRSNNTGKQIYMDFNHACKSEQEKKIRFDGSVFNLHSNLCCNADVCSQTKQFVSWKCEAVSYLKNNPCG